MSAKTLSIILFVVYLIFSGTIHEYCHARAADYFGDPTPGMNNRLTLNPIPHLDPMWSLIMPVAMLALSGGAFAFGGAKPVSMNPMNFRYPERDFTIAAVVGPISNLVLAAAGLLIGYVINLFWPLSSFAYLAIRIFYLANIILAVFNMIPIPPLDGSRVLRFFLSPEMKRKFDQMSGILGIVIIIALAYSGVLSTLMYPFLWVFYRVLPYQPF